MIKATVYPSSLHLKKVQYFPLDLEFAQTSRIPAMKSFLPIETVSKQIGLSAHTLRYYERIELDCPVNLIQVKNILTGIKVV